MGLHTFRNYWRLLTLIDTAHFKIRHRGKRNLKDLGEYFIVLRIMEMCINELILHYVLRENGICKPVMTMNMSLQNCYEIFLPHIISLLFLGPSSSTILGKCRILTALQILIDPHPWQPNILEASENLFGGAV